MDDHLFERIDGIVAQAGEQTAIVSAGEIYSMDKPSHKTGIKRIMSSRDYYRYDDLIRPQITVSQDGTLGWVIVRVQADGIRLDKQGKPTVPLAFTSAWIELYQKTSGQWRMVGNVSNFKQ